VLIDLFNQLIAFFQPPVLMVTAGLLILVGLVARFRARDSLSKWLTDLHLLGEITEDELLRPWVSNAYHRIHIAQLSSWAAFAGAFLLITLQIATGPIAVLTAVVGGVWLSTCLVKFLTAPSGTLQAEYRILVKLFPASIPRIEEFRKIPHTPWNKDK